MKVSDEPLNIELLALVLGYVARRAKNGEKARYLYLAPGGMAELGRQIDAVLNQHGQPVFLLADMVVIERSDLGDLDALVALDPLSGH